MIKKSDAQDLAGFANSLGDFIVLAAWSRISSWVVMNQNDGGSRRKNCSFQGLPWMTDRSIEASNRNQICANYHILRIQHKRKQVLSVSFEKLVLKYLNHIVSTAN